MSAGFARRLVMVLALLLLGYGAFVALLVRQNTAEQEQETQQRLSLGLARHIVEHWPELAAGVPDAVAQARLLQMLMVVNPGIQVYRLDADGRVAAYLGEPGMVRNEHVDLQPVRSFLAGAALPIAGTDPMGGPPRVFSVAMFPPRAGNAEAGSRPPGYLYIVLESPVRSAAVAQIRPAWRSLLWAGAAGLLATLLVGALVLRRLTLPLNRLAARMRGFVIDAPQPAAVGPPRDEVQALAQSFQTLSTRIADQVQQRETQAAEHREVMANVAHDLRTPLTALHGHLEALQQPATAGDAARRAQLVNAALGQSDKVRRLSQQLFELATLQSTDHVHRERFRLDELVADTVQKFELSAPRPPVTLSGPAPGPVELDGDLHLIERALTNLIDNAVRHAGGPEPVRVSLRREGQQVTVWVEDRGPGLPAELTRRLDAGQPVRDPPLRRPGGGIGGLGLAIAQRIAALHGGSLRTLPAPEGGTRLALALPAP